MDTRGDCRKDIIILEIAKFLARISIKTMEITHNDYITPHKPTWCPGCGDYSIWLALRQALANLGLSPHEILIVFGVGCSGNMCNLVHSYGAHALHGRALPLAFGARVANHHIPVIVIAGDGDQYGEGGNHFIHTARSNLDITVIVHNNQVYGLTTGQTSPTSGQGYQSKSTPLGVAEEPINPITLALSANASFIARGFSGDIPMLTNLIVRAIQHKGFSLLDVFQPCVTFNKLNTYQYFRNLIYTLEDTQHDSSDKLKAFERATETERLPIGLFYQENRQTYEERVSQLTGISLRERMAHTIDISKLIDMFR